MASDAVHHPGEEVAATADACRLSCRPPLEPLLAGGNHLLGDKGYVRLLADHPLLLSPHAGASMAVPE